MSFTRCARLVAPTVLRTAARSPAARLVLPRALPTAASHASRALPLAFVRSYASGGSLGKEEITQRVLEVIKSFEKVDAGKLKTSSSFTEDLGLDSLDAVEVVMAIEEEFSIEIPDAEADAITTVQEAIDYIAKTPEAV